MEEYFKTYKVMYGGTSFSKGGKLGYSIFKYTLKFLSIRKKDSRKRVSGQKISGTVLQIILTRNQFNISKALKISQNQVFFEKCYSKNRSVKFYSRKKLIAFLFNHPRTILQELSTQKDHLLKENWIRIIKLLWIKSVLIEILECSKSIKYLINYNDHSPYNVMIHQIGKEYDITTIYIQHANVNNKFPALYHDINLLFNQKSLEIYKSNGRISGKVELIGDVRLNQLKNLKRNIIRNRVLICPNKLDDIKDVIKFSRNLKHYGFDPVVRPHPRDKRWKFVYSIKVSRNKSVKEDLLNINYLITNESAIIIESIFLKIHSYLYNFKSVTNSPKIYDNYKFIRDGLVERKINTIDELVQLMKENKDLINYKMLKEYTGPHVNCETIKTINNQ